MLDGANCLNGLEEAFCKRWWISSSSVDGSSGCNSEIGEGDEVIPTSILETIRNCLAERFRGNTWKIVCQYSTKSVMYPDTNLK